jgi:hypothetical protein
MPVKIKSMGKGKFRVATANGVHMKAGTHENAMKQKKIIDAADAGHPFTGKHGFGVGGKKKRK